MAAALALVPRASIAQVEVGRKAPEFALPDQNGRVHRLSDYRGRTVVLAFYPKDDTPG